MNLKTTSPRSTGTLFLAPVVPCLNAAACQVPDAPAQATVSIRSRGRAARRRPGS